MAWLVFMCLMPLIPFATIYRLKLNERAVDISQAKKKQALHDEWMLHNFGIKPIDVLSDSAKYNFFAGLMKIADAYMIKPEAEMASKMPGHVLDLLQNVVIKSVIKDDKTILDEARALYQSCLFDSQMQDIIEKP